MRRFSPVVLAGALLLFPAFSFAQTPAPAQKLTFEGDTALWSVAIRPDKTADFEQVLAKLREALSKSEKPEAKQQAAGWKVVKGAKPMQDGNVVYTHVIHPVVPGADYTVMQILYDAFPDPTERTNLYNLYRGAFAANLGASVGTVVADLSKTQ
jgi:hypothetical protein